MQYVSALWSAVLMVTVVAVAGAEQPIYRWTDDQGGTHYGTRPPDTSAQPVLIPPVEHRGPSVQSIERNTNQRKLLESYERERVLRLEQQERREEAAREAEQRCDRLRRFWRSLNHPGPVYYKDAAGERRYLDDAERAAELQNLTRRLKNTCGGAPG